MNALNPPRRVKVPKKRKLAAGAFTGGPAAAEPSLRKRLLRWALNAVLLAMAALVFIAAVVVLAAHIASIPSNF